MRQRGPQEPLSADESPEAASNDTSAGEGPDFANSGRFRAAPFQRQPVNHSTGPRFHACRTVLSAVGLAKAGPLRYTVSNRRRQAALPTGRQARRRERESCRQVPSAGRPRIRACLKIERGSCGRGFWLWPRRQGPRIPNAGCKGRANTGHRQKTRRPEGSRVKSALAALLLAHRPTAGMLAPRALPDRLFHENRTPLNFQTGSVVLAETSALTTPPNQSDQCRPCSASSLTPSHSPPGDGQPPIMPPIVRTPRPRVPTSLGSFRFASLWANRLCHPQTAVAPQPTCQRWPKQIGPGGQRPEKPGKIDIPSLVLHFGERWPNMRA